MNIQWAHKSSSGVWSAFTTASSRTHRQRRLRLLLRLRSQRAVAVVPRHVRGQRQLRGQHQPDRPGPLGLPLVHDGVAGHRPATPQQQGRVGELPPGPVRSQDQFMTLPRPLHRLIAAALIALLATALWPASATRVAAADDSNIPGVPLPGSVVTGQLGGPIYDHVYQFDVPPASVDPRCRCRATRAPDFGMYLFDSSATTIFRLDGQVAASAQPGPTQSITYPTINGGHYYVDLNGANDVQGQFRLVGRHRARHDPARSRAAARRRRPGHGRSDGPRDADRDRRPVGGRLDAAERRRHHLRRVRALYPDVPVELLAGRRHQGALGAGSRSSRQCLAHRDRRDRARHRCSDGRQSNPGSQRHGRRAPTDVQRDLQRADRSGDLGSPGPRRPAGRWIDRAGHVHVVAGDAHRHASSRA